VLEWLEGIERLVKEQKGNLRRDKDNIAKSGYVAELLKVHG